MFADRDPESFVPDKLSDWSKLSGIPRPRNEQEEALAVERVREVALDMIAKGETFVRDDYAYLMMTFTAEHFKSLAYREFTESDKREAEVEIDKISSSLSEKFKYRVGLYCLYSQRDPRLVNWNDLIEYFVANWTEMRKELLSDNPETRKIGRTAAKVALEPISLRASSIGELRIAPDSLRSNVETFLEWSLELRD